MRKYYLIDKLGNFVDKQFKLLYCNFLLEYKNILKYANFFK